MCRCVGSAGRRHGTAEAEQVRDDESGDLGEPVIFGAEAVPGREHAMEQEDDRICRPESSQAQGPGADLSAATGRPNSDGGRALVPKDPPRRTSGQTTNGEARDTSAGRHRIILLDRGRTGAAGGTSVWMTGRLSVRHRHSRLPGGRASMFSLCHDAPLREVLAAAERLLAATGDAVVLCPVYGAADRREGRR